MYVVCMWLCLVVHVCIEVCVFVHGICVAYTWRTMCVYGMWMGIHNGCGVWHTWNSHVLVCIYVCCVWESVGCVCENCVYTHLWVHTEFLSRPFSDLIKR